MYEKIVRKKREKSGEKMREAERKRREKRMW